MIILLIELNVLFQTSHMSSATYKNKAFHLPCVSNGGPKGRNSVIFSFSDYGDSSKLYKFVMKKMGAFSVQVLLLPGNVGSRVANQVARLTLTWQSPSTLYPMCHHYLYVSLALPRLRSPSHPGLNQMWP